MSTGLDRIRAKLHSHATAAIAAGIAEARVQGEIIAGLARTFAPQDDGDLIRSIHVEDASTIATSRGATGFVGVVVKAGDESTVVVGKGGRKFQNARLQEVGTQDMPASPYFNPAKRMRRRAAKAAIAKAVRKAWKDGG